MNIDEQILKIIRDNTITENVITVSHHTERENQFEVLCNHGFVVSRIKQSILKAIEKLESIDGGWGRDLRDIKEILK